MTENPTPEPETPELDASTEATSETAPTLEDYAEEVQDVADALASLVNNRDVASAVIFSLAERFNLQIVTNGDIPDFDLVDLDAVAEELDRQIEELEDEEAKKWMTENWDGVFGLILQHPSVVETEEFYITLDNLTEKELVDWLMKLVLHTPWMPSASLYDETRDCAEEFYGKQVDSLYEADTLTRNANGRTLGEAAEMLGFDPEDVAATELGASAVVYASTLNILIDSDDKDNEMDMSYDNLVFIA